MPTAVNGFLAAVLLLLPSTTSGALQRRAYVDGSHSGFDELNVRDGTLQRRAGEAYDGRISLRARIGGDGNGYSRGVFRVRWRAGDDVWFGAAYRLPPRFSAEQEGQIDILRWDDYPDDAVTTDRSGVVIWDSDHRARLIRQRLGVEEVPIAPSFDLPRGRWFWLEVHQRLSAGADALSEVYVDGRLVASSTLPNSYGRPVRRVRYGIVAADATRQRRPLTLRFDRAVAGAVPEGPLPARRP